MTSRKKARHGPGAQRSRATGAADRKARLILIIVIAGVVLLIILLFLGNYLYGPRQLPKP